MPIQLCEVVLGATVALARAAQKIDQLSSQEFLSEAGYGRASVEGGGTEAPILRVARVD